MTRIKASATAFLLLLTQAHGFVGTKTVPKPGVFVSTNGRKHQQLQYASPLDLYSAQFTTSNSADTSVTVRNVNHRHSSKDWIYNIATLPQSSVLREIKNPVMAVLGWSTLVSVIHSLATKYSPQVAVSMQVSSIAHSFLVSSIGLLLVFRTNSAYQRFYEGRRIWEEILSVARNLSRLFQLYKKEIGPSRQQRMRGLLASYPYLLRHHIRSRCLCENEDIDAQYRLELQEPYTQQVIETRHEGDKYSGGSTKPVSFQTRPCYVDRRNLPWSLLTPGALDKVSRARNRPRWVLDRLAKEVCSIQYNDYFTNRERQHFLGHIEKLTNALGQCERIHQTAVPLNYARHSLRSLTIWLFTLPFCMVKDLGILTGPATAVVAWLLYGIYQIGYSIEDPFQGSLRLSILCDAIRGDVLSEENDDLETTDTSSAYRIETQSWVDDATTGHLSAQAIPSELLQATTLDTANISPLFTNNGAAMGP